MKHIFVVLLAIGFQSIYSQSYFSGIYGDTSDNLIVKFKRSDSGDYLYGVGFKGTVVKYHTDGSFMFAKKVDSNFYFYDFAETSDHSILIAGMVLVDALKQGILCKLDENGNVLWVKIFASGHRQMQQQIVKPDPDVDQFVLASWYLNSGADDDIALTKIDADGNIIWCYKYDYADDQNDGIQPDGTGGVIVVGQSYGGSGYGNIMQVDSLGNFIRSTSFSDLPYSFHKLLVSSDGNFYIAGDADDDGNRNPILIKIDSNFEFQWMRELKAGLSFGYPITGGGDVTEDHDGNIYMNSVLFYEDELLQVISKYSSSGDLIWNKSAGITQNTEPFFLRISSYYDGVSDYLNFSNSIYTADTLFGMKDVLLFNITSNGESCYLTDIDLPVAEPSIAGNFAFYDRSDLDYIFESLTYADENSQWSSSICDNPATGIQNSELQFVQIYPNPARDFICIKSDGLEIQNSELQILSSTGEILYSRQNIPGELNLDIRQLNLSPGIYIVVLKDPFSIKSEKLVIYN